VRQEEGLKLMALVVIVDEETLLFGCFLESFVKHKLIEHRFYVKIASFEQINS
jgi:hypothetical protein